MKTNFSMPIAATLLFGLLSTAVLQPASADDTVTFYKDVQPILKKHCTICHNDRSAQELNVSGGLSLANPDSILEHAKVKSVVVGKPEESTLYTRLTVDDEHKRMPKDDDPLSAEKIATLKRWIETGAELGKPVVTSNRRTRSKARVFTDLNLPTPVTPPAKVFGDIKPAKLALVANVAPLAPVTAIAFSNDGKYLAVGSFRRIVVWDLATAQPATILGQPLGMVHGIAFTPDSQRLYFAGGDSGLLGEIKGYSVVDWSEVFSYQDADDVLYGLAIDPEGKRLAATGFDRFLRVFTLPGGELAHNVKAHSDFAYTVSFSPDGKTLLTAGKDSVVKCWDPETGEMVRAYSGHNAGVFAAIYNADGKEIYSSGDEPQIFKFDAERGDRPNRQNAHGGVVYQLAWDKDHKRFISGGTDTNVKTWLPGAKAEKTLTGSTDVVYSVALSPGGTLAAAGSWDGYVRLWSLKTGKIVASLLSCDRPDDEPADWLALTADGFYSSSANIANRAKWMMSGKELPFDQVAATLAKPEEVAKSLREEKVTPVSFPMPEVPKAGM